MWPNIAGILLEPALAIAPLAYWVVFGLAMLYSYIKSPLYRNLVSYTCLVACVFGTVVSIFSIIVAYGSSTIQPAFYIFFGLYNTFPFLPVIFALFAREKRAKQSNAGKYVIYLGFLWSAVCILAGLATTIIAAIIVNQGLFQETLLERFTQALFFVILMNWGFVAVILLLTMIYFKSLTQKNARGSFLVYMILLVLSVTFFTIFGFAPIELNYRSYDILGYLVIFLVDLPIVIAVFIAFHMGHLWIGDNESTLISNNVHDTFNQQTEHNNSTHANANDSSRLEVPNNV
ncbi:hypothetical protein PS15m_009078 [Mucor circinelloides]